MGCEATSILMIYVPCQQDDCDDVYHASAGVIMNGGELPADDHISVHMDNSIPQGNTDTCIAYHGDSSVCLALSASWL